MTRLSRRRLTRFRNSAWPKLLTGLVLLAFAYTVHRGFSWGIR